MRSLVIDIETSPNLGYVWDLWNQNISLNQIERVGSVICFAAKWVGQREVQFFSDHHDGHDVLISKAHELLDLADSVIHYNGTKFDIPHLHKEILLAGLSPPSPVKEIDLWLTVKRRFNFASSKLAHVADQLGIGGKAPTGGFELWRACMAGDDAAWAKMRRYNVQDVRLTEKLYKRLLPWIQGHPDIRLYDGGPGCGTCGGPLESRGFYYTAVQKFQRFRCKSCGAWSRSARSTERTATRLAR